MSSSDITVDALFEQAGVIRADTLQGLFSAAALLSSQPVPPGDRVAIVSNAGGPAIMCADACQADGVDVPELPAALQSQLAEFLPPSSSVGNPVDMIATASADHYRRTLQTLIASGEIDAVLTIFVPPLVSEAMDVARAIHEVALAKPEIPIAAVFMTGQAPPAELAGEGVRVPGYEFPEEAARAVAHAAKLGRWRARPEASFAAPTELRTYEAAAVISGALARGDGWLEPEEMAALLGCYGLPLVQTRVVPDAEAAVAAAVALGAPVALKASASGLLHKSDVGGVSLNLGTPTAIRAAAKKIEGAVHNAGLELDGLVIQPMAPAGVELIVGVVSDPSFGPVLACGAGGTLTELTGDVSVRITPISGSDAQEMLRSLRSFPLLTGYRGAPACDVGAVQDVLLRVSAMVGAHAEIVELDCNPVIALPEGAVIVDARVRVEAVAAPPPVPSLGRRAP